MLTTEQLIASALASSTFEGCAVAILPPWMDAVDIPLRESYRDAKQLRRQRDELIAIWPHKEELLNKQYNEAILSIARDLHRAIYADES